MKLRYFFLIYFCLTAVGFIAVAGQLVGLKLILCGPAASLFYMIEAIAHLFDPEFAVWWRRPDLYKTIALHGTIWIAGLGLVTLFKSAGWKPWIAFVIAWAVAVPINLFYEMAQNV